MTDGYGHKPQGMQAIAARFKAIEAEQRALRRALTGLGLSIDPDGNLTFKTGKTLILADGSSLDIQDGGSASVDGPLTLNGTLTANNGTLLSGNFVHGSAGWRLQPTGNVEINNLTLRGGIIGDDALANPIAFGYHEGHTDGQSLTVAGSNLHTGTITVPAGFSQAVVHATTTVGGTANAPDNLYGGPTVNGVSGQTIAARAGAIADDIWAQSVTMSQALRLTGLSGGGVITVQAWGAVDTAANWFANLANGHVSAIAVFAR